MRCACGHDDETCERPEPFRPAPSGPHGLDSWVIGSHRGWCRCKCGAEFKSDGYEGTQPSVDDQLAAHYAASTSARRSCSTCIGTGLVPATGGYEDDPCAECGPCCHLHKPEGCCDPDDCGPCCERCPTCPSLSARNDRA